MIARSFPFIALLALAVSCGSGEDSQLTRIKAQFTHTNYNTVYLHQLLPDQWIVLDSTVTDDEGRAIFRLTMNRTGLYTVGTDRDNLAIMELTPHQDHELLADIRQIPHTYIIKEGSQGSVMLEQFKKITQRHLNIIDSLLWELDSYQGDDIVLKRAYTDSLIRSVHQRQKEQQVRLVRNNMDRIACLIPLFQPFGRERLFTPERYPDLFKGVHDQLMEKYPENPHVLDLHQRMGDFLEQQAMRRKAEKQLQPSSPAPEFALKTIDEQRVSLEQLQGKFVLLHFWTNQEEGFRSSMEAASKAAVSYQQLTHFFIYHGTDRLVWRDAAAKHHQNSIHALAEPMVLNAYNTTDHSRILLISPEGKILDNQISPEEITHTLEKHIKR